MLLPLIFDLYPVVLSLCNIRTVLPVTQHFSGTPAIESLEYPPYCPDGEVAAPASYSVRLTSNCGLLSFSLSVSHADLTPHTHTHTHTHTHHNITYYITQTLHTTPHRQYTLQTHTNTNTHTIHIHITYHIIT